MKIRNGFVSNSSSSSFILATTKENLESVISSLTEEQVALYEKMKKYITSRKKVEAFGKELTIFEVFNCGGESPFMDVDDYDEDDWEGGPCEKLWNNVICPGLEKDKNESFSYTVEM